MFIVTCRNPRPGCPWRDYSEPQLTREAAEAIKARAEGYHAQSVTGDAIIYRVKEI